MARLFDDGNLDYLRSDNAIISPPFSVTAFASSNDLAVTQTIWAIGTLGGWENYYELVIDTNDTLRVTRNDGSSVHTYTSTNFTLNTWGHAALVVAAVDDIAIFLDGGGKGTSVVSVTPIGMDVTGIGALIRLGGASGDEMSGCIAHPAIWDCALTDAEVLSLALGKFPWQVRPESLVAYWPLGDDIRDHVGQYHMTAYNSPIWTPHPPQMPSTKRRLWHRGLPATNLFKGHEVFR